MTEQFNQPSAGGGYFDSKNHVGHLVLFTRVHEIYNNPTNTYRGKAQPRDEAKVDLVDLDGSGELRTRIIVTHPGIVNRLVAGTTNVLGRISQEPMKDDPESFFYALQGHEDADVSLAKRWVDAYNSGQFGQPAQSPPQNASQSVQEQPSGASWQQGGASGTRAASSGPGWAQSAPPKPAPAPASGNPLAGLNLDPQVLAALQALGAVPVQEPPSEPPF